MNFGYCNIIIEYYYNVTYNDEQEYNNIATWAFEKLYDIIEIITIIEARRRGKERERGCRKASATCKLLY